MMQPHDFLRKAVAFVKKLKFSESMNEPEYVKATHGFLAEAQNAVKFILPENGRILDNDLKGLPEILKLPFPTILIEYTCRAPDGTVEKVFGTEGTVPALKRMILASQHDEKIFLTSFLAYQEKFGDFWAMQPYIVAISKSHEGHQGKSVLELFPDQTNLPTLKKLGNLVVQMFDIGGVAEQQWGADWQRHAYFDMLDEMNAVLSLVEALTCKNVSKQALPVKKNKGAQMRGALPYDEYHILFVQTASGKHGNEFGGTGSHASPREHLRRGHIRKYEDGSQTWVQATIVNAGIGGTITKSYAVGVS